MERLNLRRASVALPIGLAVAAVLVACTSDAGDRPPPVTSGNVEAGHRAIVAYDCGSCHTIPGVRGADAHVGPPLTQFGLRSFIAGSLANNEDNLVRWIMDPNEVEPGTAMPDLDVSEEDARDIAAYLLSLR